jgi:hypothetical protein
MDEWGWEQLRPWLDLRARMPIGALFCVINGPTLRAPVVWPGRTNAASAPRPRRRSETPFRSSPAPSRPCRRDGPGGRAAERHPAPARPRRPRRHVGVSAGNRQHRGDQRGPLAPSADDARECWVGPLSHRLLVFARRSSAAADPSDARRSSSAGASLLPGDARFMGCERTLTTSLVAHECDMPIKRWLPLRHPGYRPGAPFPGRPGGCPYPRRARPGTRGRRGTHPAR